MILVARNVVEEIAERGKKVTGSAEVAAGKTLPGYRSYEAAMRAQLDFREIDEPDPALQTPAAALAHEG
jgi:hypothetical protein